MCGTGKRSRVGGSYLCRAAWKTHKGLFPTYKHYAKGICPKGTMYIYPSEFSFYRNKFGQKCYSSEQSDDSFNEYNANNYLFAKLQASGLNAAAVTTILISVLGQMLVLFWVSIILGPVLLRKKNNSPPSVLGKVIGRLSQSDFGPCTSGWKTHAIVRFGKNG